MTEPTYYDVLTSIVNKKKIDDEYIIKNFSGFPAIKWLSINPMACYTANKINSVRGVRFIPSIAEYKFLKESIKLPKNTKLSFDKKDKDMDIITKNLMIYFKTNSRTVDEYKQILGGNRILKILEKISQPTNFHTTNKDIIELRIAIEKKRKELLNIKGLK